VVFHVRGTDARAAVRAGMQWLLNVSQDDKTVSGHVDGIAVGIERTHGSATLNLGASAVVTVQGTGGTAGTAGTAGTGGLADVAA
jgi:hypothetical protein